MSDYYEIRFDQKRLPGINPVGFGRERCAPGYSVDFTRSYWMLHFVISGKGTYTNEHGTSEVMPSQIFVVHPHRVHCYTADRDDPWEYMWVLFDGDFSCPSLLESDVITAPAASKIFSDIVATDRDAPGAEEYVCAKIWELMSLLMRMEHKSENKQNAYVEAAKAYIMENYSKPIMVSDIAKDLSLDRTYFSALFKGETGISPKQYLVKYRLEKAAELLMSNCAVSETAFAVGYSDNVNFSRMFKQHFGVSPMRYKEKLLQEDKELQLRKNGI